MQMNLISQNDYIDYQKSLSNISNYCQHGFRALNLNNGHLTVNNEYGLIQLIKDLVKKIFNSHFFDADIIAKQLTLENDMDCVKRIFDKFREYHETNLNIQESELYELFYSSIIARDFKSERNVLTAQWDRKGVGVFVTDRLDSWIGYTPVALADRMRGRGPYSAGLYYSPQAEKFDELAELPTRNVPELTSFLINRCEDSDAMSIEVYLRGLRKDHPTPRVVINYCLAVHRHMLRQDKRELFEDKEGQFRLKFIEHSLAALEPSWDDKTLEWLIQTTQFYAYLGPNEHPQAYALYKQFLDGLVRKHPEQTKALNDFVRVYLN